MNFVYLDNAATTKVSRCSADAALSAMLENWGNPSSVHHAGFLAQGCVENARSVAASELGAQSGEIYFCSGGTEANNTALFGAARARRRRGNRIVISGIEHSSVDAAANELEREGFELVKVSPVGGSIRLEDVEKALTPDTILLSFMLVNNENGAILPIEGISRLRKRLCPAALLHCDGVQAFGKLPLKVNSLGCELLSVSGHKIGAPKGIGALYVQRGVRLEPIIYGGEQQDKLRPGTESVPLIAAFGAAVGNFEPAKQRFERVSELNRYLRERLSEPDLPCEIHINSPDNAAPWVLSIATGCIKSETMLNFLSAKGIYISAGSACAKGRKSRILTALKLPDELADSTLRISFCTENTKEDIDAFVSAFKEGLGKLARF